MKPARAFRQRTVRKRTLKRPTRAAVAAILKAYGVVRHVTLTLDDRTVARLKRAGDGSASEGARRLALHSLSLKLKPQKGNK